MVAGLLWHPKRQLYPQKIIGIQFTFITKIAGDTLLTKMPAELPSSEQIFTETSRLVPLVEGQGKVSTINSTYIPRGWGGGKDSDIKVTRVPTVPFRG